MSPRLSSLTFKHKVGSEVKFSGKQSPSRKTCFWKLKCRQLLFKTFDLYFLRDSYTSKNILGTKNVRYGGIFKASKKTYYITHILKVCRRYFKNIRYSNNRAWFFSSKLNFSYSVWLCSMFWNKFNEEINLGLKIYIKVSNFAIKVDFSIFQKNW